jgi:hypothetical protein
MLFEPWLFDRWLSAELVQEIPPVEPPARIFWP